MAYNEEYIMRVKSLDGKNLEIKYKDITKLRQEYRLETFTSGAFSLGGSGYNIVIINTKQGAELLLPRCPENDTEILDFLFVRP
ncbi:MAG: hypothetical protein PHE67_00160 [Campylobacterales bacterium]|nr:hypothetical protein [Campylobacterales bacterium]